MSSLVVALIVGNVGITLVVAAIIFFERQREAAHRWLAGFLLSGAFWGSIVNLQSPSLSAGQNLLVVQATFVAAMIMVYAMMQFVMHVVGVVQHRLVRVLQLITTLVFLALIVDGLVIPSVAIIQGHVVPERTALYGIFIIYVLTLCIISLSFLVGGWKVTQSTRTKAQLEIIFWGLLAGIVTAVSTNLVLPNLLGNITPARFAWLATVIWTVSLVYAVVRKGFLDIKLAAVRSVTYGLAIATLALIYYSFAYLISTLFFYGEVTTAFSVSPFNIVLALLLAFIFQPIKTFFDRITDTIFFRGRYNAGDFYKRLSSLLGSTTDLRGLLHRAAHEIGTTLKAERTFFYVWQDDHSISTGTKPRINLPEEDMQLLQTVDPANVLDGVIVRELLDEYDEVRRMLVSHKIFVALPLRQAGRTIGYVLLGEHQAGGYTNRDIRVLNTIASELVIAIQNALSIQAVKDLNTHLQQRIDAATQELQASNRRLRHVDSVKDEFLSMASHQLRTPLTSVKGYISMMLDGDIGKISSQQRTVLSEAYASSERMVSLIHDFLNVSRLQTGKFVLTKTPTNLDEVVKGELRALERIAESRDIKLVAKLKHVPTLMLDESKLRQVIMNFVDNALYYTTPKTPVVVSLRTEGNEVELLVRDHGIGVPKHERKRLFEKFYRASNARERRPDGTGVGLYLAKKVVDAHGGTTIYAAHQEGGSSFGFTLPIADLAITEDLATVVQPETAQLRATQ